MADLLAALLACLAWCGSLSKCPVLSRLASGRQRTDTSGLICFVPPAARGHLHPPAVRCGSSGAPRRSSLHAGENAPTDDAKLIGTSTPAQWPAARSPRWSPLRRNSFRSSRSSPPPARSSPTRSGRCASRRQAVSRCRGGLTPPLCLGRARGLGTSRGKRHRRPRSPLSSCLCLAIWPLCALKKPRHGLFRLDRGPVVAPPGRVGWSAASPHQKHPSGCRCRPARRRGLPPQPPDDAFNRAEQRGVSLRIGAQRVPAHNDGRLPRLLTKRGMRRSH